MKLTTEFCIYRSDTDDEVSIKVVALLEEIAAFANIKTNSALWSEQDGDCVYTVGFRGEPHYGDKIPCSEIHKTALQWIEGLVAWCKDDPDEETLPDDEDDDEESGEDVENSAIMKKDYANRSLRIEAEDLDYCGGIRIRSFDIDGELCDEISFVAIGRLGKE